MGDIAREIVEEHLDLCLDAGINHEGINAEVAKGQWEFQIFGKGSKSAADEMWVARYILNRLCEKYGIDVEYHCKPLGATDWNGSGMHANFSTKYLREAAARPTSRRSWPPSPTTSRSTSPSTARTTTCASPACTRPSRSTSSPTGVADRGASDPRPAQLRQDDKYKGYLEDRRPNSQGDPYQIASRILKTISLVPTP